MNFKTKAKANTTLKYSASIVPKVLISEQAINEMYIYTKEVPDEVGWLGTVEQLEDGTYYIGKTYLFDQEVHGTTTEITPEGLSSFGEELLKQPDGMDIWNSLKMWGHSHVNMGTTPSGQDDKQMQEFENIGHEYFIRLICNKKGELRIDFYNYEAGLTFLDVPYGVEISVDPAVQELDMKLGLLEEQRKQLEHEMQLLIDKNVTEATPPIKEEIKQKVKKKVYTTYKGGAGRTGYGYGNQYGYWQGGVYYTYEDETAEVTLDTLFTETEIKKLAEMVTSTWTFRQVLKDMGYDESLSDSEIQKMYSKLVQIKYSGGKW